MTDSNTTAMFRAKQNFSLSYYHTKRKTKIKKGETIPTNENFRILNGVFFWVQRVNNEQTTRLTFPLPLGLIEKI